MTIYILDSELDGAFDSLVIRDMPESLGDFDGRPMGSSWVPFVVDALSDLKRKARRRPLGDFPFLASHLPVFSQRAAEALMPHLHAFGELLPLKGTPEPYFLFNVTQVIDALDVERSVIARCEDTGDILFVEEHVFREGALGPPIFRVPESRVSRIFVDDRFVEWVRKEGLKGAVFTPTGPGGR